METMIEFWKNKLDSQSKKYYDKMLNAFHMQKESVDCGNLAPKKIFDTYSAILNDHPELFYLSYAPQIQQKISTFSVSNSININNIYDKNAIVHYTAEIQTIIKKLDSIVVTKGKERDIELAVCDYLIENVTYKINNKFNQNVAAVLVSKQGQCSGIAKATKLLLSHYDIECIVVEGEGKNEQTGEIGPHAWNIVKIDKNYHHLDVTYMIGSNVTKQKPYRYTYFNYSDNQISKDHFWNKSIVPCCNMGNGISQRDNRKVSDNKYMVISSLYEMKRNLKSKITQKENEFIFRSAIAGCYNAKDLFYLVQSSCQSVINAMEISFSISISIEGDIVLIRW